MGLADVREKIITAGFAIDTGTPEYFAATIKNDYAKYGKLVRDIGLQPAVNKPTRDQGSVREIHPFSKGPPSARMGNRRSRPTTVIQSFSRNSTNWRIIPLASAAVFELRLAL